MKEYIHCTHCTPSILFFGLLGMMLSAFLSMSCEPGIQVKDQVSKFNRENVKTVNFVLNTNKLK